MEASLNRRWGMIGTAVFLLVLTFLTHSGILFVLALLMLALAGRSKFRDERVKAREQQDPKRGPIATPFRMEFGTGREPKSESEQKVLTHTPFDVLGR